MTYVVAFDGSDLAERAVERAADLADGTRVVAVAVVPRDAPYALDRGWIESEAAFDAEAVAARLEAAVEELAPGVEFRAEFVAAYSGPYTVSRRLGKVVRELDPEVVFLGSENVGRVASPVSSVGTKVAGSLGYDVYLVRTAD